MNCGAFATIILIEVSKNRKENANNLKNLFDVFKREKSYERFQAEMHQQQFITLELIIGKRDSINSFRRKCRSDYGDSLIKV